MTIIHLNGKSFVPLAGIRNECFGYYQVLARSLRLYDADGAVIGAISEHGVLYRMVRFGNGRFYFSYDPIPEIGEFSSPAMQRLECLDALRRAVTTEPPLRRNTI
ncbi:hypothetical protein [Aminobacter sp. MET-1]|uniref:hypothetical protein n=1 Tax=Aminobacter sp. MET-1 TaxID=2951085 RepID=UPI00226A5B0D|nr:hypothetical protein [Aminobacter sp. MET-1]MCX8571171.1 hypothetical protein [Aminobacter sp. MET-1]MCX8573331.1 hypothetical protein [Aminobacter sp. MET-1]